MSIAITNFRAYEKGSLRGFFDVTLPSGMILRGCKLFQKETGSRWIGLPSEKFTDRNGADGFRAVVEFTDCTTADKFRVEVLDAIDAMAGQRKHGARQARPTQARSDNPDDSDFQFPF